MKRFVAALLTLALTLTFVPSVFATSYAPGTYIGEGTGFDGTVTATVTVSSDKITSCTLSENRELPSIDKTALSKLQEQVLAAGSADIDGVAGATMTSNAVKEAVANALKPAELKPVTSSAPPQATTRSAEDAANILYDLGLFSGTGTNPDGTPDFDLDRAPTRNEAVTMLVRLLGKEGEAKAGTWDIPFEDVANWAKPYVGFAYASGLTTGTGATTFGGENAITAAQYLTFVLRALGYTSGTDFQWDSAWTKTDEIKLTDGRYNANTASFTRGDVAIISNSALSANIKNSGTSLLSQLVASGAVAKTATNENPDISTHITLENLQGIWGDYRTKTHSELIFEGNTVTYMSHNSLVTSYSTGTFAITDDGKLQWISKEGYYYENGKDVSYTKIDGGKAGKVIDVDYLLNFFTKVEKSSIYENCYEIVKKYNGHNEPTPAPTPEPVAEVGEPISYSGTGDKVITGINIPFGSYYAEYTHNGKHNFISKLYYGDKSYDYYTISNKIGACSGQVALYDNGNAAVSGGMLEVKADGNWTISIKPVSGITTTNIKGTGTCVTGLLTATSARNVVSSTHSGAHNFIVKIVKYNGTKSYDYESVVNEIGTYSGQKVISLDVGESYYVYVQADGEWSVDFGLGDNVTTYYPPTIPNNSSSSHPSDSSNTSEKDVSSFGDDDSDNKFSSSDIRTLSSYANSANTNINNALQSMKESRSGIAAVQAFNVNAAIAYGEASSLYLQNALDILNEKVDIPLTDGTTLAAKVQEAYDLLVGLKDTEATEDNVRDVRMDVYQDLATAQSKILTFKNIIGQLLSSYN